MGANCCGSTREAISPKVAKFLRGANDDTHKTAKVVSN